MRKVLAIATILGCIFIAPALSTAADAPPHKVTVSGDPCTVPLAKKVGDAFSKKTGIEVVFSSGKCRSGVAEVLGGNADIGLATFNFDKDTLDKSLKDFVVGKAPIVMVVNKSNKVGNLSLADLKGILAGKIRNWKEVGGKDMEIKNVLLQPCVTERMA